MKAKGILIDSDIIIWLLRGEIKITEKLKKLHPEFLLFTTPITVAEIYAGVRKNEKQTISELFQSIEVLSINKKIGILAGEWMDKYSKSHSIEIADSLIAASAHFYDLNLWTLNIKHYPMLKKDAFL